MSGESFTLQALAHDWHAMDTMRELRLKAISDRELTDLLDECAGLTNTNCWYAVYQAAKDLPDAIRREQYLRTVRRSSISPHGSGGEISP